MTFAQILPAVATSNGMTSPLPVLIGIIVVIVIGAVVLFARSRRR